uniref:Uncharacterized protein n=1 Tax=Anguilla anguilla TaxID=7936 RepID=A0A0E9PVL1_ANGAN
MSAVRRVSIGFTRQRIEETIEIGVARITFSNYSRLNISQWYSVSINVLVFSRLICDFAYFFGKMKSIFCNI